jgi:hypothetical protein
MELVIHISSYVGAAFGLSALVTGVFALLPVNKPWKGQLEIGTFVLLAFGAMLSFAGQAAEYAQEEEADELLVVLGLAVFAVTLVGVGVSLAVAKSRRTRRPGGQIDEGDKCADAENGS